MHCLVVFILKVVDHALNTIINIQFNSIQKLYLKTVTQKVYNLFLLRPSHHVNKYNFSYIYTKQHRFIGQTRANTTYTFIQKHIHQHSYLTYTMYKYSDLICIEKMLFNIDLNVFTLLADFICSGILFQIRM